MRRTRLFTATALAACLVLTACGGEEDPKKPASQDVAEGSVLDSTWPLTGLPVTGDDSASQEHPVMVVKIDNTASSAPQVGLGKADLVVEELVEGGMTRLAAFFYSELPGKVGPVRSMRASDIGIVAPSEGAMVTSGAAGVTIDRIKKAGIEFFAEGAKGISRDSSRSAPYNLFSNLPQTATLAKVEESRPDDYLEWGTAEDLPKGQPAKRITASFSGGHTTEWSYDGKTYSNVNTHAAEGDQFQADTVLVLRVPVGDAGYTDPAGNPVPETKLDGKGQALLFHGGRLVRGTWTKDGLDAPIRLATKAGDLTVPAGHTWVELVPNSGGNVTFGK
ncbi:DUF3048 domain-containing protein [Nocardioides pantholopis]|uniref:DUF3048 domain-containing protein n=1 Tax=Nocardioides pantholopis TaxID=2483798 RepID=UPI0013E3DEB0|nr:DUF3048 domain-containing protein [Nocardioides pantholopis]